MYVYLRNACQRGECCPLKWAASVHKLTSAECSGFVSMHVLFEQNSNNCQ
jgi:hypothetical protein